jgi:hypothetical protein
VKKELNMNISFENKVALVTGAGSGMGLATAKADHRCWHDEGGRLSEEQMNLN